MDTFSVSFFFAKDSTINTRCSIINTRLTDWTFTDQGAAGLRLSQLMTHSAIGQLHTSGYVTCLLCDRIITRGLWHSRTPDLSFCDFYLWGNLKERFYKNNARSIEALQNKVTRVIGSITVDELQKVLQNLFMWCEACLQAEAGTFNTCYKAR
jgi:hypothetical protein